MRDDPFDLLGDGVVINFACIFLLAFTMHNFVVGHLFFSTALLGLILIRNIHSLTINEQVLNTKTQKGWVRMEREVPCGALPYINY